MQKNRVYLGKRKVMIWHFLKTLVSVILPVFYKRVQVKNIHYLNYKGPAIIAMNHPNAFTDPIYLTYLAFPVRLNYLARGDAFKPGFASYMLEKIGIIPIFRMRDGGKEGLKKNDETYKRVNHILSKNGKMMVFAEGLCIQERRLRPLKKGVARMVFGAVEELKTDNLVVIPVGVNYSAPDKFRSDLFYNIGEPIAVKDFIPAYQDNPAKAQNLFLQHLEPKMKALITHIEDTSNDLFVEQAEILLKPDVIRSQKKNPNNLEHDFEVLKEITEKINLAFSEKPILVNEAKELSRAYFKRLSDLRINDRILHPDNKINYFVLSYRTLIAMVFSPVFFMGCLFNFLPMYLSHQLTIKIIKAREFYSSIVIGTAMIFFWLNYLLIFFGTNSYSTNPLWPLFVCSIGIVSGILSLYYYPFVINTIELFRAIKLKGLLLELKNTRAELVSLINKF